MELWSRQFVSKLVIDRQRGSDLWMQALWRIQSMRNIDIRFEVPFLAFFAEEPAEPTAASEESMEAVIRYFLRRINVSDLRELYLCSLVSFMNRYNDVVSASNLVNVVSFLAGPGKSLNGAVRGLASLSSHFDLTHLDTSIPKISITPSFDLKAANILCSLPDFAFISRYLSVENFQANALVSHFYLLFHICHHGDQISKQKVWSLINLAMKMGINFVTGLILGCVSTWFPQDVCQLLVGYTMRDAKSALPLLNGVGTASPVVLAEVIRTVFGSITSPSVLPLALRMLCSTEDPSLVVSICRYLMNIHRRISLQSAREVLLQIQTSQHLFRLTDVQASRSVCELIARLVSLTGGKGRSDQIIAHVRNSIPQSPQLALTSIGKSVEIRIERVVFLTHLANLPPHVFPIFLRVINSPDSALGLRFSAFSTVSNIVNVDGKLCHQLNISLTSPAPICVPVYAGFVAGIPQSLHVCDIELSIKDICFSLLPQENIWDMISTSKWKEAYVRLTDEERVAAEKLLSSAPQPKSNGKVLLCFPTNSINYLWLALEEYDGNAVLEVGCSSHEWCGYLAGEIRNYLKEIASS